MSATNNVFSAKTYWREDSGHLTIQTVRLSPCFNPDCYKIPEKVSICARCHIAKYCGRECQKKDFPFHKRICTKVQDQGPGEEKTSNVASRVIDVKPDSRKEIQDLLESCRSILELKEYDKDLSGKYWLDEEQEKVDSFLLTVQQSFQNHSPDPKEDPEKVIQFFLTETFKRKMFSFAELEEVISYLVKNFNDLGAFAFFGEGRGFATLNYLLQLFKREKVLSQCIFLEKPELIKAFKELLNRINSYNPFLQKYYPTLQYVDVTENPNSLTPNSCSFIRAMNVLYYLNIETIFATLQSFSNALKPQGILYTNFRIPYGDAAGTWKSHAEKVIKLAEKAGLQVHPKFPPIEFEHNIVYPNVGNLTVYFTKMEQQKG